MSLRFSAVLITGTVISVSLLAHPSSAPTTNKIDALARVEGIFSYCAKLDPKSSAKYMQAASNILGHNYGSENKTDSKTSKDAYPRGVLDPEIAKLPVSTVVGACKNFLAGK